MALFRASESHGWRVGILPAERETALAIVRSSRGQRPFLKHCAVHPAIEIRAEHVLAPLNHSRELARAAVSGVLSPEDYQLLQVEAPEVAPAELRGALRWRIKDLIDFPASEAVIDVFDVPEQVRHLATRKVFAVAARDDAVRRVVGLVQPRAKGFDVIDIPELCLRNLAALLPEDEQGVALLALGEGFAQLVLTCQGVLYLARRIELTWRAERSGEPTEPDAAALAVELQRSLDYYESHYDREPIVTLVVASGDGHAERLSSLLATETGLEARPLAVQELLEIGAGIEPNVSWPGLVALGAALRAGGSTA